MFSLSVPHEQPLTSENNAQQVFVVMGQENDICGVYPSVSRALLYIKDWVGSDKDAVISLAKDEWGGSPCYVVSVNGQRTYEIRPSHYRI